MVSFTSYLLPVAAIFSMVTALPPSIQMSPNVKVNPANIFSHTNKYPMPNDAHVTAHDPNLLEHKNAFYMFKGGVNIPIFKATDLNGPWKEIGTVLPGDSVIKGHGNATRPWAPTTVEWKGKFYCFYSLSAAGSQHSAIGVASTDDMEKGSWKDHGALLTTGDKNQGAPYDETNAIDPSFIVDQKTGAPYLNYGSYWKNIWQIPLADDLLSLKNNTVVHAGDPKQPKKDKAGHKDTKANAPQVKAEDPKKDQTNHKDSKTNAPHVKAENPKNDQHDKRDDKKAPHKDNKDNKDHKAPKAPKNNKDNNGGGKLENNAAVQLTFMPGQKVKPEEGSWISYHDGFYYLWFSQGKCCDFNKGFPKKGGEYHIRVGRSKNVSGPFHDRDGKELLKSGGTTVYASNHGTVYAPGGLGVLPGTKDRPDVLYYHYLDTTVGFGHKQAKLGWNFLEYEHGWPVARKNKASDFKKSS